MWALSSKNCCFGVLCWTKRVWQVSLKHLSELHVPLDTNTANRQTKYGFGFKVNNLTTEKELILFFFLAEIDSWPLFFKTTILPIQDGFQFWLRFCRLKFVYRLATVFTTCPRGNIRESRVVWNKPIGKSNVLMLANAVGN